MRALRRAFDPSWRSAAQEDLARHLMALWAERGQPPVGGYIAAGGEPDIAPLLDAAIHRHGAVLLPRVDPSAPARLEMRRVQSLDALRPGWRGLPEPDPALHPPVEAPPEGLLLLVPGLAFDAGGRRLGQGGGHYDGLLARWRGRVAAFGVAWSAQIVDAVPVAVGDEPVHGTITERGWTIAHGRFGPGLAP